MRAQAKKAQKMTEDKITTDTFLKFEDVHLSYGQLPVLRGITLEVKRGEVVVIIGPSGGGKSSLLRTVNVLQPVTRGRIVLEDEELTSGKLDENVIRQRVGMVFQQFHLFPHLTVLKNLTLAPRRVYSEPTAEAERRAQELLDRVGLADRADHYPDQLSGGQQQRVAIARALMMKPHVMQSGEQCAVASHGGGACQPSGLGHRSVRAHGRRDHGSRAIGTS